MRKESIGRLLLTLLTAFVMVAGVFGAAVQTWTGNEAGTESTQPHAEMAASEFDAQARGTGDAPVSALDSDLYDTEITGQWSAQSSESESRMPHAAQPDMENLYGPAREKPSNLDDNYPSAHGTRAATVDAGGPYGERPPGIPYYEGDTVDFEANIIGGSNDDYMFRWEVTGDGQFDGPGSAPDYWGAYGENEFSQKYLDNNMAGANVEAWDGVSMKTFYDEGQPLEGTYYYSYWYFYTEYLTVGWEFDISQSITIDELGMFRAYYPYQVYYVEIWETSSQSVVATTGYMGVYPTTYSWNYWPITPVTIGAGNYIVAMYCRTYYYYGYIPYCQESPSDDVITAGDIRYEYGYGFPIYSISSSNIPMVSFHYTYSYQVPDVLADSADLWVDNVVPVVGGATAIGSPGKEGSEIGFTGSFIDPGLEDDWWYRCDFGDGTVSDWVPIRKWGGGATILFCTSWTYDDVTIIPLLDEELGPFDVAIDIYDWGPLGENSAPPLDLLMQYNVVIAAENYISTAAIREDVGDVLADYSDAGGNVLTMWVSDMFDTYYGYGEGGVTGRWRDEQYNVFTPNDLRFSGLGIGTVYDPGHPIMAGVSSLSTYYGMQNHDYEVGTIPLADNSWGEPFVGYKDNPLGSGGRIVGIDMFPISYSCSGDYMILMANAVKWASQAPPPYLLPQPLEVGPMYHVYKDDHPTTLTPIDMFNVKVEVKDDDHEKITPIGEVTTILDQDFSTGVPPSGWYRSGTWYMDWIQNNAANAGGVSPEAAFVYYMGYGYVGYGRLHSGPIDTTGFSGLDITFKEYLSHYGGGYTLMVETSTDGVNWDTVWEEVNPTGWPARETTFTASTNIGSPTTYFSWTFYGDPWNLNYWFVDDILSVAFEGYEMFGLGYDDTTCEIENVWPEALASKTFQYVNDESTIVAFEGFTLYDAAMKEESERFWYRLDYDDGTGISPWMQTYEPAFIELEGWERDPAEWPWDPWVHVSDPLFEEVNTDAAHGGMYGLEIDQGYGDMWTYRTDVSVGKPGDTLSNWVQPPNVGTYGARAYLGFSADSTGCYCFVIAPNTNQIFFYNCHPYGAFIPEGPTVSYTFTHDDWYFAQVEWVTQETVTGRLFDTDGTTLLAEVTTTISGLAPGGVAFRCFDYGGQAHHYYLDQYHTIARDPIFPTTLHQYMDNGIYYVDYMIIDDDMWWDFSSGYPVFMGPSGEDPEDWISHNVFPVEIENVDPVISPKIRAYVELDLSLRMSGNKRNTATMRLIENGATIGEVTVERDPGAPDIGVLPAVIEMTKDFDYQLEIEYDPNDMAGANPTWIFETHWPDGKFKQLKHTFNSNDPSDRVWTIGNLKSFMLGHDVIFEVGASDHGSDDLAFIWNWGDTTPHGVHIYACADPDVKVGVSDEATVIFNQDPDRDPWFDKGPNTIRSPFGNDINVVDTISHVFDVNQPYYYYVMLTVIDDDIEEDYPSTQLHNIPGSDVAYVEVDFT